jgi:hypothetical protein
MQKNSTSTIVRRFVLVIVFATIAHLAARASFALQAFGLNHPQSQNCWIDPYGQVYSNSGECKTPAKATFWQYTNDWWPIIGTHIIGIIVAIAVFCLVAWIFFRMTGEYIPCKNTGCTCASHKAEVFNNGEWDAPVCTDPNCPCVGHHDERFSDKKGRWVSA